MVLWVWAYIRVDYLKQYLDRFIRFVGLMVVTDRQTDRQTHRHTYEYTEIDHASCYSGNNSTVKCDGELTALPRPSS